MKISNNEVLLEEGEPVLRSCWQCNPAHEYLKERTSLHLCFMCDRYFIFGKYISPDDKPEDTISWLNSLGIFEGDSTKKA